MGSSAENRAVVLTGASTGPLTLTLSGRLWHRSLKPSQGWGDREKEVIPKAPASA